MVPVFLCNNVITRASNRSPKSKKGEKMTLEKLISKRKQSWEEQHSIERDISLTDAIADKILTTKELREQVQENPHLLIEACFSVIDKRRRRVPFILNDVQRDFISKIETLGTEKPYFVLKGRQQGFTTIITAIQLSHAIVKHNFSGFTVADRDDNTKAIFNDKAKVMLDLLPKRLQPTQKFNSVNEMYFSKLNSSWRIASATPNVGRSRTLSFIHFSEIAFYRCPLSDLQRSIAEAATEEAFTIYETTANGFNEAKALWDSGSCHNLFYEWWRTKEYVCADHSYLNTCDKWLMDRLSVLKEKGLTDDQLAWYAKKYSLYIDKSSIKQEYPCSPEEAFIVSGDCIFNKDEIANYLSNFNVKSTLGRFKYEKVLVPINNSEGKPIAYEKRIEGIEFVPDPQGFISIVEEPYCVTEGTVTKKAPYVIGADTAGTGADYFTAKVINNISGRCVATLRKQRIDEDLFAEQLYCLGKYYNNALLAVEINFSAHPVKILEELEYPNLYKRLLKRDSGQELSPIYGFLTTYSTRPLIISNLVMEMRENLRLETDRETLNELASFVRDENGRCEAAGGGHDDLVIASAIARYVGSKHTHEMEIIDTGSSFLDKLFANCHTETNQFMEW